MAGTESAANPPATSGGINQEQLNAAIASALKPITDALAPLAGTVSELAKNQKIFADTYAADQQKAADAAKAAEKKDPVAGLATDKTITLEDVAKLLDQRDAARQQSSDQKAARDAFVADPKNGIARLPDAYKAQLGADPAKWPAEAAALKSNWEKFVKDEKIAIPDVGGANREGGTTPASGGEKTPATMPGVDPNRYDYLKMPGEAGNPQPAAGR